MDARWHFPVCSFTILSGLFILLVSRFVKKIAKLYFYKN